MKFNPNIHKRRSIRLKDYNYASEGCYFITICCAERRPLFGMVRDNQTILNEYGLLAQQEWVNTANKRINVELGEFIFMPNHMHGIVIITDDTSRGVCNTPLQSPSNTLGAIIRGYKASVTSQLQENLGLVVWQRNYYEHIIRNEKSYDAIASYIENNPYTWEKDEFFMPM
ncbi:transposase [Conservatibacter flavescens]|uniref:Transposase IS200-like domain-containing protein n=1 Tax=Conservatibacter flavescens TaxID=28161 RepID=A0A2M8S3U5_9PAST|nr:transposase [Conservatibacter flavescens]PJG85824.1 hypothetical protein CVP05_04580 [Conservatibacter flavescens]